MHDSWLKVVGAVHRPARPERERCLRERETHLLARRSFAEARARAVAQCEARIEEARAAVLAANDGVVSFRMRDLEREWLLLTRSDAERGLRDLWARVAPVTWIDRKRWRDSAPAAQLDAAIALAADADGVEAAEAAVASLRVALAAWGLPVGSRIRWHAHAHDFEHTTALLAEPLRAAADALSARGVLPVVVERARGAERDVREAARVQFLERPLLVDALGHASFVDFVWRAASLAAPSPVTALSALWMTGYALSAVDPAGVTLEIPPL